MDRNGTKPKPDRPSGVITFKPPPITMEPDTLMYECEVPPGDHPRRLTIRVDIERPGVYSLDVRLYP